MSPPVVLHLRPEGRAWSIGNAILNEQETRNRLGKFGLADASRPGEERNAARAHTARHSADSCHSLLDHIHHMGDSMVLALDTVLNEVLRAADFGGVDLAPGVLCHADLVAPDGIGDLRDREGFAACELGDRVEIDERRPSVSSTNALTDAANAFAGASRPPGKLRNSDGTRIRRAKWSSRHQYVSRVTRISIPPKVTLSAAAIRCITNTMVRGRHFLLILLNNRTWT
jgi:hypothetical protein